MRSIVLYIEYIDILFINMRGANQIWSMLLCICVSSRPAIEISHTQHIRTHTHSCHLESLTSVSETQQLRKKKIWFGQRKKNPVTITRQQHTAQVWLISEETSMYNVIIFERIHLTIMPISIVCAYMFLFVFVRLCACSWLLWCILPWLNQLNCKKTHINKNQT